MDDFKRKNKFGGRGDSGGFSGRNSGRAVMHKVVCSACGKDCEVPFKPTGNKPVFCDECFRNKRNAEPRRFSGRDSGRFNSRDKRMYQAICDKCGKECEVPFKPSGNKPIYCDQCFGRGDKTKTSGQANNQLDAINTKLDKILEILSPSVSVKADEKKKIPKPKKVEKNKAKKVVAPKKAKSKPKSKLKVKKKK